MKPGNGKIANIPSPIRDELNVRISDGDEGIELVEWLNAKPEVTEVLKKLFDGAPISEQNLSEWKKRGYQEWLAHRNSVDESFAVHDNSADIAATGIDPDKLLLTLTGAYAEMTRNWMITPGADMLYKLTVYKKLTDGVIALQRAELQKVRLEIARERLALLREKRLSKSASSSSSRVSASADREAPEGESPSSPVNPETPEPDRAVIEAPPPTDEADPAAAESFPKFEESPANVESLPAPADPGTASQSAEPEPQEMDEPSDSVALAADQEIAKPASPGPTVLAPQPELSAPSNVTPNHEPVPAPPIRPSTPLPTAPTSTATVQTKASQPPPATPPKPASPQDAPLWPTRRPGGPPRNASARNPFGLL